jgi:hypothetical protein
MIGFVKLESGQQKTQIAILEISFFYNNNNNNK